jgi:hypothetical protein
MSSDAVLEPHADAHAGPSVDLLIATLFYLLSRFAFGSDPNIAHCIVEHFQWLEAHPDCGSDVLRHASELLARQWKGLSKPASPSRAVH